MDGILHYFVLKNYKGILRKKLKSNTHLFFIPVPPNKYVYVALIGQLDDEENTYASQLLVRIPEDLLEQTINGEIEYFGDRFVEVERLPCKSSAQAPGNYLITFKKKGYNILSNLDLKYGIEYSTSGRKIYLLHGNFNLITGEITNKTMNMMATKQAAFMGDKQRFDEILNISKKYRRL